MVMRWIFASNDALLFLRASTHILLLQYFLFRASKVYEPCAIFKNVMMIIIIYSHRLPLKDDFYIGNIYMLAAKLYISLSTC